MSNYRGIFPGTFTMGNVVCGFIAILNAVEGDIITACWFVLLAGFLDALDGKVARLSGASSQFGIELDSLADVLSFGAAPAVIIYSLHLSGLGKMGWIIICSIFLMAAVYRLARFNLMADTEEKVDFLGLPVPIAAMLLVTYVIFCYEVWGQMEYAQWLVAMIILVAFLMVSQVQYDVIPEKFETLYDRFKLIFLILAGFGILFKPRLLLFPLFSLYILFGISRELYRLFSVGVGKMTGRNSNNSDNGGKGNLNEQ